MTSLREKTMFITGASRGIGKAIALRAARDGAYVVVTGKTSEAHATLEGTIHTTAREIEAAGGQALALMLDVRNEQHIADAVERAAAHFGGIDILVNNASAIHLSGSLDTPMKRFDLMHQVNVRATFTCSQVCLPYLLRAGNPHILNLAPPVGLQAKWFSAHLAYTMSKVGMSLCVLGMAEEFRARGVAVNALWPRTTIATAAVAMLGGESLLARSRKPSIVADAAHAILRRDARTCTGNFFIDEDVLRSEGMTELSGYAVDPTQELALDLFVDP